MIGVPRLWKNKEGIREIWATPRAMALVALGPYPPLIGGNLRYCQLISTPTPLLIFFLRTLIHSPGWRLTLPCHPPTNTYCRDTTVLTFFLPRRRPLPPGASSPPDWWLPRVALLLPLAELPPLLGRCRPRPPPSIYISTGHGGHPTPEA